ncbi:MAG TPA: hypothetical protein VGD64_11290 [Acidisarcina sp.]
MLAALAGVLSLLSAAAVCVGAQAQSPVKVAAQPARIKFSYDNPGVDPSQYWIEVDETGHAHYRSQPMVRRPDPDSAEMPAKPIDKDLALSAETVDFLFRAARGRNFFAMECEGDTKGKVAFQGKKQLTYQGADGSGACSYNWSRDEVIQRLSRVFEGISLTVETGGRLTMEHKHDMLALDHDLGALAIDFKEGRAAELGTIAGELESIAEDDSVMDRARTRAARLLREPARVIE